jgi:hypothetical protein
MPPGLKNPRKGLRTAVRRLSSYGFRAIRSTNCAHAGEWIRTPKVRIRTKRRSGRIVYVPSTRPPRVFQRRLRYFRLSSLWRAKTRRSRSPAGRRARFLARIGGVLARVCLRLAATLAPPLLRFIGTAVHEARGRAPRLDDPVGGRDDPGLRGGTGCTAGHLDVVTNALATGFARRRRRCGWCITARRRRAAPERGHEHKRGWEKNRAHIASMHGGTRTSLHDSQPTVGTRFATADRLEARVAPSRGGSCLEHRRRSPARR